MGKKTTIQRIMVLILLFLGIAIAFPCIAQAKTVKVVAGKTRNKSGYIKPGNTYIVTAKNYGGGYHGDNIGLTFKVPKTGKYSITLSDIHSKSPNKDDIADVSLEMLTGENLRMNTVTPFNKVTNGKKKNKNRNWLWAGSKAYCDVVSLYPQAKGVINLTKGQVFLVKINAWSRLETGVKFKLTLKKVG